MKNTIQSQELLFTSEDKIFLNEDLLPKEKKAFLRIAIFFTLLTFIAPYLPGKFGQKALIQKMSYIDAVFWFGLFFSLIIFCGYFKIIVRLKKDISQGYKYIYQTKIERKSRINNDKYEIRLQLNPNRNGQKIYLKRPECYDWQLGDTIEVEFLKHTGTFLILKNTTQNQVFRFKD
ncbi:hypothetical protein ACYE2N_09600 [Flavobacterium sp. MAHUQ-51]|uniref:hypothetical protein n=1 Tax=Flavobacterium sp. GCM10022190 TaxID=3252639 RepID=UPI003617472D